MLGLWFVWCGVWTEDVVGMAGKVMLMLTMIIFVLSSHSPFDRLQVTGITATHSFYDFSYLSNLSYDVCLYSIPRVDSLSSTQKDSKIPKHTKITTVVHSSLACCVSCSYFLTAMSIACSLLCYLHHVIYLTDIAT